MYVLTNGNKYADGKYLCVCDTIPKNQDRDTNTAYPVRMRTSLQRFHELGHIHQQFSTKPETGKFTVQG